LQRNLERVCSGSHPLPFFISFLQRKFQFFFCIPRYIQFCFVLGSGAKGYGRHIALITSPYFITSVRSKFRKGNSRLWHVYRCRQFTKTSPESILHTIDLYQLITHSCRPQILRSAMMFLYLLVSVSLRIRTACFFATGGKPKKSTS
jgi:hypothetical protein